MRKLLFLLLILTPESNALFQGTRYDNLVLNSLGQPVGSAKIPVCTAAATGTVCAPLATIYSDAALTQVQTNPFFADNNGNYGFWAPWGRYKVQPSDKTILTSTMDVTLPIWSGIGPTILSSLSLKNLNSIRFADQFAGADWTAKVIAADTDCGANPCTIYVASSLAGSGSSNITVSTGHGLLLAPGTFVSSGKILLSSHTSLVTSGIGVTTLQYNGTDGASCGFVLSGVNSTCVSSSSVSNISVSNVTVDGNLKTTAVYINNCTNCIVNGIVAKNGWSRSGIGAPIAVNLSTDVIVRDSFISGGRGIYGDGIYFSGCVRCTASHNHISDVTRIGIVFEQSGSTKSVDAYAEGNTVTNAHDATGGQLNSCGWAENTNSAKFIGNHCDNLDNGTGTGLSRGLEIGPGSSVPSTFIFQGNDIREAAFAYVLGASATDHLIVEGGTILKGNLASYNTGISILGGRTFKVKGVQFGDTTYGLSGGAIGINGFNNIDSISLEDLSIGTMTQVASSADVNLYSMNGFTLSDLSIRGLTGASAWTYAQSGTGTYTRFTIADSFLNATPRFGSFPAATTYLTGNEVDTSAVKITGGTSPAAGFVALGTTTVGALPKAAAGNVGQIIKVSDSTAITTEGQTCVGGGAVTALAFSTGVSWKCF